MNTSKGRMVKSKMPLSGKLMLDYYGARHKHYDLSLYAVKGIGKYDAKLIDTVSKLIEMDYIQQAEPKAVQLDWKKYKELKEKADK